MLLTTHSSSEARIASTAPTGPVVVSLDRETRSGLDTATAAYHLNRRPQTLRAWACKENGPLRAVHLHGRLMWLTADIRKLCGVA